MLKHAFHCTVHRLNDPGCLSIYPCQNFSLFLVFNSVSHAFPLTLYNVVDIGNGILKFGDRNLTKAVYFIYMYLTFFFFCIGDFTVLNVKQCTMG